MVKQGITNFFKNLKYFFTPLGALFLGVLFGACFLFSGFKVQINQAATEIKEITEQANVNVDDLKNCVIESFSSLTWDNGIDAIKTIFSKKWIDGTLKVNLENTIENYKLYAHDVEKTISNAINGYKKYIVAFAFCAILGLVVGFFLTKFLIRRNIAKRNVLKLILTTFLDTIFTLGITILTLWLTTLWAPNIVVISVLGVVLYGFVSLFEAYIVHGYKKLKIKQVVNFKNILTLLISNLLIYTISFAISSLIITLTNKKIKQSVWPFQYFILQFQFLAEGQSRKLLEPFGWLAQLNF